MNENINLVEILKQLRNKNPVGLRIGHLTIICELPHKIHPNGRTSRLFKCRCDCGNITYPIIDNLRRAIKQNKSCSCGHCGRVSKEYSIPQGTRFGRLMVIKDLGRQGTKHYVYCRCDCGKELQVPLYNLNSGKTLSCGCLAREGVVKRSLTHGMAHKHPLYDVWRQMKERCNNPNNHAYKDYGGRGIKVCEEWLNDFNAYFKWAIANGWENGLTIDRINNNGDYSPHNCRFVSLVIQARNKRNNKEIIYNGKVWHSLAQFCDDNSLAYATVQQRLYRGWSIEEAIINAKK